MKKLFILLPLTTMFLVSLAVPIPSNNSSTVDQSLPTYYDRRYQLFDAILAYKNALLANEIITSTENVGSILKDYSQWLRRHNTINRKKSQLFQDLKENLENFTETIEIFRNDSHNCQLQRKVQTQLYAVDQVVGELNSKPINQIWDKHYVRYTDEVENYDFELLATHVQSFLRSLNEAEVTENKELLAWCQEFLTTREPEEKRVAFKLIRSLYDEELQLETKAGQPNCQLLAQIEWKRNWKELRLQMYANQLNALEKQIKEAQALKKSLQQVIDLYKHEDKAFVRGLLLFGLLH